MNIDNIVTKIAADAKEQAAQTLRSAEERARDLEQKAEVRLEKQREEARRATSAEAEQLRERMLRMAALQEKKDALVMKREVVDQAFDAALQRLMDMPREDARKLSLSLLLESAQGDEAFLFGPGDEDLYDGAFLQSANEALKAAGKAGTLHYEPQRLAKRGGFVLRRAGMQMEMTWEMVLRVRRDALEADVANMLFT